MEQREVTDQGNTAWTCVQAYAALGDKAASLTESGNGTVTLVCTPGGGAQTVRIEVGKDWMEKLTDEQLLAAISQTQQEQA
ncbi:hypothetical protein [Pontibacter beigongshangensis]|uniref:hypothetical protein n=1 Tax=Pontibacter beigongshangensis TaxID=2574733 RepID=UPI00164F04D2|nr:hypothetical protein [Pontibacter beigongshangensis]